MRILIDCTSLLVRSAGVKNYAWHLLRNLQEITEPGTVRGYPFIRSPGVLDHERSPMGAAATMMRLAALHLVNHTRGPLLDVICGGVDVLHASNQVRVAPRRTRLTATIHDLTCWLMPEVHTAANVRADANYADRILKRADRLIAVSENTRQDAIRILGLDPDRIDVIYSGVDERFFEARPARRERPYVLFLGTIEPRKNLDVLLDGWRAVRAEVRREFDLVVAGPSGWKAEAILSRLASEPGVHYLGYVSESELPGLTAGASAFAYVSLYEGFGFPVAQAMAARVPVVTSATSCLPEVVGDGALCVDPRSPAEIAVALERVLTDSELRSKLGAAGRERAMRLYRWPECARESLRFFERAIS